MIETGAVASGGVPVVPERAVPDFPAKDIVAYFTELGVELSVAELVRPTPAVAWRVYEQVTRILIGVSIEEADEALLTVRMVQQLGTLLARIGVPNFSLRDLTPEPRRFLQILSALTNFAMFRDTKQGLYERVARIADSSHAAQRALEDKIAQLEQENAATEAQLTRRAADRQRVEDETARLEQELKELYRRQKDKASELALLKAEKTEISDKLGSCQLLEHNLQQEILCLRAQIVNDPTKLVELVEEMRGLIEREKATAHSAARATAEKQARLAGLTRIREQLSKAHAMCTALAECTQSIERTAQAESQLHSRLRSLESTVGAEHIRIEHAERQLSHLEGKIETLQARDRSCSAEISEKMAQLRVEYGGVSEERERVQARIRENNRRVQSLVRQQAELSEAFNRECAEMVSALVELSADIDQYFAEVNKHL